MNADSSAEIFMNTITKKSTLQGLQEFVKQMEVERGFSHETVLEKCLLLGEEVGELFKAIRKSQGIKTDSNSKIGSIEHELADVLIYVLSIANKCNIDLEAALISKEEENQKRKWS